MPKKPTSPGVVEGQWLTVKEAASQLRVSESLIRQMFHEGRLAGVRVGSKLIRIAAEGLKIDPPKRESPKRPPPLEILGDYKALGE